MPEGDRIRCEFSLVRYVPDPVKNEFVNIGVLLRDAATPSRMELRFTRDWRRVRCIDPDADIAMLEAIEIEWRKSMATSPQFVAWLRDTLSNTLQITEPKGCLAETFAAQMEQLMRLHVEAHKAPRERKVSGRASILSEMRTQFEQQRVWDQMNQRLAMSKYMPGDPSYIDCGYRTNGAYKMFHAISLLGDLGPAKEFALTSSYLFDLVKEKDNAKLTLTAITEPIRDVEAFPELVDQYVFGRDVMKKHGIRVIPTTELPQIAAAARGELRIVS